MEKNDTLAGKSVGLSRKRSKGEDNGWDIFTQWLALIRSQRWAAKCSCFTIWVPCHLECYLPGMRIKSLPWEAGKSFFSLPRHWGWNMNCQNGKFRTSLDVLRTFNSKSLFRGWILSREHTSLCKKSAFTSILDLPAWY